MTGAEKNRGGAPVGWLTELDGVEAASVIYLRLWSDGPESQASVWSDFATSLGADQGRKALNAFADLCTICLTHGRRPLMRHAVNCRCLGADESCFAHFISAAIHGDRDDAMLIATLLVRADVAPLLTSLATDVGLALKRMNLRTPKRMHETHQSIATRPIILHCRCVWDLCLILRDPACATA